MKPRTDIGKRLFNATLEELGQVDEKARIRAHENWERMSLEDRRLIMQVRHRIKLLIMNAEL